MVITDHNPMDQHFARHPEELSDQPLDDIQFDVENNKLVLESHLQCAAEELPINIDHDQAFFGPNVPQVCEEHLMLIHDKLYRPDPRYRPYPAQHVNIRNITQELYAVINTTDGKNAVLEEIESTRAPFEIYEGAVFIHQGRTYLVEECNVDQRYAKVHAARVDYTTQQRDFTNVNAITTVMSKPIQVNDKETRRRVFYGRVQIETVVFGYYRMDKRNRIIDSHDIYMDPIIRQSMGIWLDVPSVALKKIDELEIDRMASIHGAAHAMISLLPSFASSTAADIRTECKSPHATRPRPPRIALYESQPSGIIRQAYQFIDELLEMCIEQIQSCACDDGCPSCVHLSQCSEHNELCSKHGALVVLQSLRITPIDIAVDSGNTDIEQLLRQTSILSQDPKKQEDSINNESTKQESNNENKMTPRAKAQARSVSGRHLPKKNLRLSQMPDTTTTSTIPTTSSKGPIPTPPPERRFNFDNDVHHRTTNEIKPLFIVKHWDDKSAKMIPCVVDLQVSMLFGMTSTAHFWKQYPHLTHRPIHVEQKSRLWPTFSSILCNQPHHDAFAAKRNFIESDLYLVPLDQVFTIVKQDYSHMTHHLSTQPVDTITHDQDINTEMQHETAPSETLLNIVSRRPGCSLPPKFALKLQKLKK